MQTQPIRAKYDRLAPWYDLMQMVPEGLGIARLRRKLLSNASGDVLDVGCGTGSNLSAFSTPARILGIDVSKGMLSIARIRARSLDLDADFAVMNCERLALKDRCFDTVISSLALCTFDEPDTALSEMSRVCRRGGRILLLEHGRSSYEWLGRWQDRRAESHARLFGCRWNREPIELVRNSNISIIKARRIFCGILHLIEATPS